MDPAQRPNEPYRRNALLPQLPWDNIPANSPEALVGAASGPPTAREAHRHRFDNIATHDSARVHLGDAYGDQHNHYYATPTPSLTPDQVSTGRLMDALYFDHMDFRSSTIAEAY